MGINLTKVSFEEIDEIGYLTISDPPANKTTVSFLNELIWLVRNHIVKSKVKGIIITGKGRHYSSGADVEELREVIVNNCIVKDDKLLSSSTWYEDNRRTYNFFYNMNIPVISAIKGFCIGSGMELALNSHIRICAKGSMLGLPESTFGFLPGVTGTFRYVENLGFGKALELVMTGEMISAEEAVKIGAVDASVEKKELMSYCEQLIKFILDKGNYCKDNVDSYIEEFNMINNKNLL